MIVVIALQETHTIRNSKRKLKKNERHNELLLETELKHKLSTLTLREWQLYLSVWLGNNVAPVDEGVCARQKEENGAERVR